MDLVTATSYAESCSYPCQQCIRRLLWDFGKVQAMEVLVPTIKKFVVKWTLFTATSYYFAESCSYPCQQCIKWAVGFQPTGVLAHNIHVSTVDIVDSSLRGLVNTLCLQRVALIHVNNVQHKGGWGILAKRS